MLRTVPRRGGAQVPDHRYGSAYFLVLAGQDSVVEGATVKNAQERLFHYPAPLHRPRLKSVQRTG